MGHNSMQKSCFNSVPSVVVTTTIDGLTNKPKAIDCIFLGTSVLHLKYMFLLFMIPYLVKVGFVPILGNYIQIIIITQ